MNIKPKNIIVNLPIVLLFDDAEKLPQFASSINSIINGKVKVKYEELGILNNQSVGLFYLQRNKESQFLREKFISLINNEEIIKNE